MFAGSKGARVAGRGGAFGAKADDLSAVEYNPAGLARIGTTTLQLSNRFSYNKRTYWREPTPDGSQAIPRDVVHFEQVQNEVPWQLLEPMLGATTNFGLKDFGFALAAYTPPGVAHTKYPLGGEDAPNEGGQRYMMVELESAILTFAASAAYKFKDLFGIGASFQWVTVPRISYSLVVAPVPFGTGGENVRATYDMYAQVKGSDPFIFNTVLGAWFRPLPFLEFAASGQVVPSRIKAKGELTVTQVSNGNDIPLYRPISGEDNYVNDVELQVPLPMWARLAARYVNEDEEGDLRWDLELDFTYHTWSRVENFYLDTGERDVPGGEAYGLWADHPAQNVYVGNITIDKQWRDSWQLQLGSDVAIVPQKFIVRAGAGYESPVAWKKLYTHVDFPTGDHISGSVGASLIFGGLELAAAYAYRHQFPVTVLESEGRVYQEAPGAPCEPPYTDVSKCPYPGQKSATVNGGNYTADSHFLTVDAIYRF